MSGPLDPGWFARLGRDLLQDGDVPVTLDRVVERGAATVPGAEACSLTLRRRRGTPATAAATDEAVAELDAAQYGFDEGPCLQAVLGDAGTLVSRDLAHELRWPRWSKVAVERGYRSVLAVRLQADDGERSTGALNLYASDPDAFTHESVDIAEVFAEHAAMALDHAHEVDGLRTALESRHRIGMAQGVLAVRYGIGFEEAFEVMRRLASDTNTKLRDLAAEVLERRELPAHLVAEPPADAEAGTDADADADADEQETA